MEKRLPLALLLCFLILVGWQILFPAPPRPEPQPLPAGEETSSAAETAQAGPEAPATPEEPEVPPALADTEERTLVLEIGTPGERGSYRATFTNRGGRLSELRIGNWYVRGDLSPEERLDRENWTRLLVPVEAGAAEPTASMGLRAGPSARDLVTIDLDQALWTLTPLGDPEHPSGVEFRYDPGRGIQLVKRIRALPDSYELELELELVNTGDVPARSATFFLTPAECVPQEIGERFYIEPQAIAVGHRLDAPEERLERTVRRRDRPKPDDLKGAFEVGDRIDFAGVHNKYFAVLARGANDAAAATLRGAEWRRVRDEAWARENPTKTNAAWHSVATDLVLQLEVPPPGDSASWRYRVYCGPKDRDELVASCPAHAELIGRDLGFFDKIASFLLLVLGFLHRLVGNWGVAIILLTLGVRLALFPVNRRSQTAMARYQKKMKRVQPKIDEIKKKYEKNPQKLRQEQARIMQEEGAFPPLGGCLPMFVQIPIFFGLFSALRTSFDLRQAPFVLWIHDLSRPDRLLELNFDTHLPILGTIHYLNVLPPIMVVMWVLQQRMMPAPADEQAQRMQKMMMWMPVMMGFFLYNYAAGLSLYMITTSSFGIIETGFIKKKWPIDDSEVAPKKRTGFMARVAEMQKEQMRRLEAQKRGGGARPAGKAARQKKRKSRR